VRIAIVDVGTNTTRLLIADVQGGRITGECLRESRVTRLGAEVDAGGHLREDALEREHAVLADYRRTIDANGAERAVAVMTSAVRDAANGREFAEDAAARYGLAVHVLTGEQEARLTYLGATDDLGAGEPVLVLDIGGGSTELAIGHGDRLDFHVSTQAGVVRQADRHIHSDPPSPRELEAVARDVRGTIAEAVPDRWRRSVTRALAVAGTPTSVAAIAQELDPYDPAKVHHYRLTAAQRDEILARLREMPLARRRHVTGLHPDRAITILPGIVILREVMELFGLEAVEVSEHDILRGAALAFGAGGSTQRSTPIPDVPV
jgi:exopolyphosphatase/guanosine-5'-triphosphate,3'-diphosphate pyrophosphatase